MILSKKLLGGAGLVPVPSVPEISEKKKVWFTVKKDPNSKPPTPKTKVCWKWEEDKKDGELMARSPLTNEWVTPIERKVMLISAIQNRFGFQSETCKNLVNDPKPGDPGWVHIKGKRRRLKFTYNGASWVPIFKTVEKIES